MRQPMTTDIALEAGKQRSGSVPELVLEVVGMP
jgi:hypothetical protein